MYFSKKISKLFRVQVLRLHPSSKKNLEVFQDLKGKGKTWWDKNLSEKRSDQTN